MVDDISIIGHCPICKKSITFYFNKNTITTGTKFPVLFKISHCGRNLLTYVDSNLKCIATKLFGYTQKDMRVEDKNFAQPISSELSPEVQVIYEFNNTEISQIEKIPNLVEKHLIRIISKKKEVSLARIIKESKVLEKALNRSIDKNMILNILEKYIQADVIVRHNLKLEEEELSSLLKSKTLQGGNI